MKITVDNIIFGYVKEEKDLKILLIKRLLNPFSDKWALAGGFVHNNESLEEAAFRELKEETGLEEKPYLEQLYTFGEIDRDPRERIISVSYYGLVNTSKLDASSDAKDAKWFSINELPKLAFDHDKMIEHAIERLRGKITYQPIGLELLDSEFTIPDVHKLYETILNKKIDRRNFQKKFLKLDILEDLNKYNKTSVGRPSKLYKFDMNKYKDKINKGLYFEI